MSDQSGISPLSSNPATLHEESWGSSVSSQLRDEYEDLLRYAVVMPMADASVAPLVTPPVPGGESLDCVCSLTSNVQ